MAGELLPASSAECANVCSCCFLKFIDPESSVHARCTEQIPLLLRRVVRSLEEPWRDIAYALCILRRFIRCTGELYLPHESELECIVVAIVCATNMLDDIDYPLSTWAMLLRAPGLENAVSVQEQEFYTILDYNVILGYAEFEESVDRILRAREKFFGARENTIVERRHYTYSTN